MGLDTSHGCWHGPYSQFMRWRLWLAKQVGVPLQLMEGFYKWTWDVDDLTFDRDWKAIHDSSSDFNRSHCWWETLDAFKEVGRPIPWSIMNGDPIVILLHHSDCDGKISWWECKPIAIRLARILRATEDDTKWPTYSADHPQAGQFIWADWRNGRGCYDGMTPATKRFISGLIRAHKLREHIRFG